MSILKRLRGLAAGGITGEIKQCEYHLAAEHIAELEDGVQYIARLVTHHNNNYKPETILKMIQNYYLIRKTNTDNGDTVITEAADRALNGWQPIETVPTDNKCLLAIDTDDGYVFMQLDRDKRGNWLHEGEPTYCGPYYFKPTHWMPLPTAPDRHEITTQKLGE